MKIIEFIFAVIVGAILFPIGIIFEIFQIFKLKLRFVKWMYYLILEIVKELYNFFEVVAVFIDKLGNIILGRLFESIFVYKADWNKTLFSKAGITISASFGQSLKLCYLNERGIKFSILLDKVLGRNHCLDAYEWYKIKKDFNNNNKTGL